MKDAKMILAGMTACSENSCNTCPYKKTVTEERDCFQNLLDDIVNLIGDKGYEKGAQDAWDAARSIMCTGGDACMYMKDLIEFFDSPNPQKILEEAEPLEAIKKVQEWRAEEKIRMGDVVETFGAHGRKFRAIYYADDGSRYWLLVPGYIAPQALEKDDWELKRTGECFEIKEMLKAIGE